MTKTADKQSIFDLVLQETGGLNLSAKVLHDNGLDFNDSLAAGTDLKVEGVEKEKIKNNYILNAFKPNNSELATVVGEWILTGGIWDDNGVWIDTELWEG